VRVIFGALRLYWAMSRQAKVDNAGRKRFGHITLFATLLTIGTLTLGFTALAVRLCIGLLSGESIDSTLIAEVARAIVDGYLFAAFQAVTALLLIAVGVRVSGRGY
jgi:hypothetical protein